MELVLPPSAAPTAGMCYTDDLGNRVTAGRPSDRIQPAFKTGNPAHPTEWHPGPQPLPRSGVYPDPLDTTQATSRRNGLPRVHLDLAATRRACSGDQDGRHRAAF